MPPRTALFDKGARDFICRSCLLSLQKRRPPPRWLPQQPPTTRQTARYSSSANHAQPKPSPAATASASAQAKQDDERRKVMAALGLLDEEEKVSVNYFEQDKDGSLRRLDSAVEFGDSLNKGSIGAADKLKLDDMLQEVEEFSRIFKALEETGGKEQVTKLKKRLAEDLLDAEEDGDTSLDSLDNSTESILIREEGWAGPHTRKIHKLNIKLKRYASLLSRGESNIAEHQRSALWKSYTDIRKLLGTRRNVVPAAAWDLLWRVLATEGPENQNRMAHISVLSRDMQGAGVVLNDEQQLLAIEAMFIDGHEKEALDNHRRLVTTLGTQTDTALDFWELGLRMHCLVGDLERARRAVDTIVELPGEKDPHFLFPYIRACAENPQAVEMGYNAYRRLHDMLGERITIEDYDQIIAYFLTANQAEYALYVFVDMMSSGTINVKGAHRLPPTVANPFFFGKWVKRLIGSGEVDSAYKVFLLMKEIGVVPRPLQVNGLLGAWLRSNSGDMMAKAESVAWEMINARIQFVQLRKQAAKLNSNIHLVPSGSGWPNATLETFSLLAESYNQRGLHLKMVDLWKAFREAEIAPDSFIMNQLLYSYLKDGQGKHVADLYRALSDEHGIKPDPVTFRALWLAIPANRLYTIRKREYNQEIPQGRSLFAEMVQSTAVFQGQDFDYQLARKILHSFRKIDDKVGLLQAVRGLKNVFKFYPPEPLILELLADTVDIERMAESRARNGLILHTSRMHRYLKTRRLELVKAGKLEEGVAMDAETQRRELYKFLESNLEASCLKSALYPEGAEIAKARAAQEMGLDSITTL